MGNTKKQPPDNANRHLFVTGRRGRRPLQMRETFPPRWFVFRNNAQGWATDGRPHDFSCQNNSFSRRRRISHAVGIFHARSAFHPTIGRISPRHREVTPAPTPTNESSVSVSMVRFPKQSARVGNRRSSSRFFLPKQFFHSPKANFTCRRHISRAERISPDHRSDFTAAPQGDACGAGESEKKFKS